MIKNTVMANILRCIVHGLENWVLNLDYSFLTRQSTAINEKPIIMSWWFFTVEGERYNKISKYYQLKINRHMILSF